MFTFEIRCKTSVVSWIFGHVSDKHTTSCGHDRIQSSYTAKLPKFRWFMPISIPDFDVTGAAVFRFLDVQIWDIEDYLFSVGGCYTPFASFFSWNNAMWVGWCGECCGVCLISTAAFYKEQHKGYENQYQKNMKKPKIISYKITR